MKYKRDMNSYKIKSIAKKLYVAMGLPQNKLTVKSAQWMKEQSLKYEKELQRNLEVEIETNIIVKEPYPLQSMAIEKAIEIIVNQKKYKFSNMLVIKNPYQYAPLCAMVVFYTKKERNVRVTVFGKEDSENISYEVKSGCYHTIPIMGLYPGAKNKIKIELFSKKNKVKSKEFFLTTDKLKGKSSGIKVNSTAYSSKKYAYDLTLIYGGDDGVFPYAFDRKGDLRFCFSMVPKTYGFKPISKGRYLFLDKTVTRHTDTNPTSVHMYVVDQMGRFLKRYNVEKGAHHDFCELDNGNYAVVSNAFDDNTIEDSVIEIEHNTGKIVNEIWLKDYVDSRFVDSPDWAHINTLEYDNYDKTLMVCLRNLHAVIKLNYEKKQVEWVLGNPEFFKNTSMEDKVLKPVGDIEWFFQAHSAYFIDEECDENGYRKLIIYDNHINKRRPVSYYNKSKNSYAKIYQINESKGTVRLYKTFVTDKSIVRSIAICEKEIGRVCVMNGKVQSDDFAKGTIIEFDYQTGEMLNRYTMNFGFYRAYPFEFCPEYMSQIMERSSDYCFGKMCKIEEVSMPDITIADKVPPVILESIYSSERERTEKLKSLVMSHPEQIDSEQDMARIKLYVEEDLLCVKMIDHLLDGVYLIGKENAYYKDLSQTSQKRPEYFARVFVGELIPLNGIKDDKYTIYYNLNNKLYRTDNWIQIRKVEKNEK